MKRTFRSGLLIGLAVAVAVAAVAATYNFYDTRTLKRTVRRGEVLCGVNRGLPGFSIPDDKGNWTGFDVDFCRAVASAIFDDPTKAKFIPLDANERFKELQNRKVDILSRNSTWSMSRETDYDLYFPAVAYYDGQGFMLPRSRNIDSALDYIFPIGWSSVLSASSAHPRVVKKLWAIGIIPAALMNFTADCADEADHA